MSRQDFKRIFQTAKARKYQMSQKAPKEQMPALIAELANRSSNVKHMKVLRQYLETTPLVGAGAIELGQAMKWLENIIEGEDARCKELKELLPDKDTVVKLGPDENVGDAPQNPEGAPQAAVGGVELQKGEPVLGAA